MPDRIIAATALALGLTLVTRDAAIRRLGIETVW
jgi:predicted nucleic acid-binding protein